MTGVCPVCKVAYSKGMSPGLAARTVVVCVLVLLGGISRADRRPVAVVDLSGDVSALDLARELRAELVGHPELQRVQSPADETALSEPIHDEDRAALEAAANAAREAEVQRSEQFQLGNAVSIAQAGQARLLLISPTATIAINAATPTITPSMVRADRILLRPIA